MERIKLTKAEKQVLRGLYKGYADAPYGIDNHTHIACVISLTDKSLVRSAIGECRVVDCRLTPRDCAYLNRNPRLYSIVELKTLTAINIALFIASVIIIVFRSV